MTNMRKFLITAVASTAISSPVFAQTTPPAGVEGGTGTTDSNVAAPSPNQSTSSESAPDTPVHAPTSNNQQSAFVTAQPTDILSYNIVDLNITNDADETVGEIKDLIISNNTLAGYILSVGGFLGLGERYVIVNPNAVSIHYNEPDKKWTARMATTKEVLQEAPEFIYEGRWDR